MFRSPLLAGLDPADEKALEAGARPRRFEAGETLFAQGEPAANLYVIMQGRVRIWRASEAGAPLTLTMLGPHQPIGTLGVLDHRINYASATAVIPVEVMVWRLDELQQLMGHSAALTANVLRIVTSYAEQLIERLEELSSIPVDRRIARTLVRAASRLESTLLEDGCRLHLSRQDLAELTSATLPTVSRIMSEWRRQGWIDGARGQVAILDCAAIRGLAGMPEGSAS